MKAEQLFEALSYVDEDLLLASESLKNDRAATDPAAKRRKTVRAARKVWIPLSACACLVLILALPLGRLFFRGMGGGSASMESTAVTDQEYDAGTDSGAEVFEAADADDSSGDMEDAAGANDASGDVEDAAVAETESSWIQVGEREYLELSQEELSDYGITEADPESSSGSLSSQSAGQIEDASDPDLVGRKLYASNDHEGLFLVETSEGYRYFRPAE